MAVNVGNVDFQLTAAAAAVLTAQANGQQITILKATVVNTDTVSHAVTVYRVANGGSAGPTNVLIDALSVGAGETATLPLSGQSLVNQQSLYAFADTASKVNLNIGYTYQP